MFMRKDRYIGLFLLCLCYNFFHLVMLIKLSKNIVTQANLILTYSKINHSLHKIKFLLHNCNICVLPDPSFQIKEADLTRVYKVL